MRQTAKGRERRDHLVQAAKDLLASHDLPEISMRDIAERAGIPSGSAYHFFDGPAEVFAELARRFGDALSARILTAYSGPALESWHTLYRAAALRGIELYREEPAYCPLILGSNTTSAIKSADRDSDFALSGQVADLIDRHFVLPPLDMREERFFRSIVIVDLFLCLSYQRHGRLEPELVEDGIAAALAYLRQFIPDRLPRRDGAPDA